MADFVLAFIVLIAAVASLFFAEEIYQYISSVLFIILSISMIVISST